MILESWFSFRFIPTSLDFCQASKLKLERLFFSSIQAQQRISRRFFFVLCVQEKINNMEKQSKDLENIKIERDSLQATLKETYANY